MATVLILVFHPRLEDSRVNNVLIDSVKTIDGVTVRDVYELYPDLNINIKEEQKQLLEHDHIILQHPFYWYSCPPLMKQWIDLVLEHGWAYGKGGEQLKGKNIFHTISSGGTFEAYQTTGKNRYTYKELLRPFELTANLCLMEFLPPFIVPGANKIPDDELRDYAAHYKEIIRLLLQNKLGGEELNTIEYWNHYNFS